MVATSRDLLQPGSDHVRRLGGRPGTGVHQAAYQGRTGAGPGDRGRPGPPRKLKPGQIEAVRRMREGGASLRRIADAFECWPSTVLRALCREAYLKCWPVTVRKALQGACDHGNPCGCYAASLAAGDTHRGNDVVEVLVLRLPHRNPGIPVKHHPAQPPGWNT